MDGKNVLFSLLQILLFIGFATADKIQAQNRFAYPVIFVHGLAGSEATFGGTLEYLRDEQNMGDINVFDVVLNADDNTETALINEDVKWENFVYNGDSIFVGRRNYASSFDDYVHEWSGQTLFAANFKEENIRGAAGTFNDYFDQSNQSAIFKQGHALKQMISEVLDYTGAEKVILVGHSMGGLAIREYLQRTDGQGTHVNWQQPFEADGHKVARVVTFGTPHLGSNTSPDPTKSGTPSVTGNTEANRDLLWEYDAYTFCDDNIPRGIYMFGGYEECIASEDGFLGNSTFDNVDINCNGSEEDSITGINEGYFSYNFNPDMPLPENIRYTWLTSIWADWSESLVGDGAVDIHRQWLHVDSQPVPEGLADTCLTNVFHTSEGGDYPTVMRGLDEPADFNLAYTIIPGDSATNGYITFGQNYNPADRDMFLLPCDAENAVDIILDNPSAIIDSIRLYDKFHNEIIAQIADTPYDSLHVELPALNTDSLFVCIKGTATDSTWQIPYKLTVKPSELTDLPETQNQQLSTIYPNPASKQLNITVPGNKQARFSIFATDKQKVFAGRVPDNEQVSLPRLDNGIYIIKIIFNHSMETHKISIIQ
ncbi:MAG: T9SS type A sorting domain-containing protein [Bacteroidales bacterium]